MTALKLRLEEIQKQEYSLLGISCHLKDYRLIYEINKELKLDFKKVEDLVIYPVKGKKENCFSCYFHSDEFMEYNIIANRNPNGLLVPEHKQLDYIFILKGLVDNQYKKKIISSLVKIPQVLTSYEINQETIKKNIDVILTDLELHILKIK